MKKQKARIGVAAIFKNEAPYIIEWIAHHRLQGVTQFYIAENNSTDQTRNVLQQLSEFNIVSWFPWPSVPGEKPQVPAYRHILASFTSNVDWIAYLDADEYIWKTTDRHLGNFLESIPEDVGAVALNWATYGSSDQYFHVNASTPERFIWHASLENIVNRNFKSIARPSAIQDFTCPHNVTLHPKFRFIHPNGKKKSLDSNNKNPKHAHCQSKGVSWDDFRINHYIIRSWEEYATKKSKRGRAFSGSALDELYFWGHDFHEDSTPIPNSYAIRLQQEIKRIQLLLDPKTLLAIESTFTRQNIPPSPILGNIESVSHAGKIVIQGWALEWARYPIEKFDITINNQYRPENYEKILLPRPDVLLHHKSAALLCGFSISIKSNPGESIQSIELRSATSENKTTKPLVWIANPQETKSFICEQEKNPNIRIVESSQ